MLPVIHLKADSLFTSLAQSHGAVGDMLAQYEASRQSALLAGDKDAVFKIESSIRQLQRLSTAISVGLGSDLFNRAW